MTGRLGWPAVELMARALDPDEREAVLGDLAERGGPCDSALRDIFGLVIRREAALWTKPRPWFILIAVVIPLGLLISVLSRITSGATGVYVWLYANNTDWDLLRSAGFWYVLGGASYSFFTPCLALVCWSWTVGFVIGAVSGRFVRGSAFVFLLILLIGEFSLAPRYLAFFWHLRNELLRASSLPTQNDPVSAIFFYRVIFPLLVQIGMVAAPALWGLVVGTRLLVLMPLFRACVWTAAMATVAMMIVLQPGFGLLFYRHPLFWLEGAVHSLQLVIYWPILYLLAVGTQARLHPRTT